MNDITPVAVFLYNRPWPVEEIYTPGTHLEIGNKNMVDVGFVLEKRWLLGFFRVFRNRPSYHYKPVFLFPFPANLFLKFPYLPTILKGMKPAGVRSPFDVGILFGSNHITASSAVQESDHPAPVISRVHSEPQCGIWQWFGVLFSNTL